MTYVLDPFVYLRLQASSKVIPHNGNLSVICDLACGEGIFMRLVESIFPNALKIGIDIDNKKLKRAKLNTTQTDFILADIRFIPLRLSSCDLIFCFEAIEHLDDTKSFLHEVRRILTSVGSFVISTPNIHSLSSLTAKFVYFMLGKKYVAFDKTHINLFWPNKLFAELERASFKILDINGFWLLPVGLSYPPLLRRLIKHSSIEKILIKTFRNKFLISLAFITIVICKRR